MTKDMENPMAVVHNMDIKKEKLVRTFEILGVCGEHDGPIAMIEAVEMFLAEDGLVFEDAEEKVVGFVPYGLVVREFKLVN